MFMRELIAKKRDGGKMTPEEIKFIVQGYVSGLIPDYQMSAFLMAVVFRGMDSEETHCLTMEMVNSGDVLDLSGIEHTADKHSTGGVGDKTSLVLVPMVASLGMKMAKMSGRGLGFTGGTLDKLESIPGFNIHLTHDRFMENVKDLGMVIAGQTARLVPADKLMYALRDATSTVPSMPLIVSSIMSKKLAAGAQTIVLDVKLGSGAFMKTPEEAAALAREMVNVGKLAGRNTVAVVTDMSQPLGNAIGNALEVKEAIATLKGEYSGDLLELCLVLGSCILTAGGQCETMEEARERLLGTIADGSALRKLEEFIVAQDGDGNVVRDSALLPMAPVLLPVPAETAGYVTAMAADAIGTVALKLGGGRATKEDDINHAVGVELHKKVGDYVEAGESLATIHANTERVGGECAALLRRCIAIGPKKPADVPFIYEIVR